MKEYKIIAANVDDVADVSSFDVTVDDDHSAGTVCKMFNRTVAACDIKLEVPGVGFVVIENSSDGDGYLYDVYESREDYEKDEESIDGGLCTGTILDALQMAGL